MVINRDQKDECHDWRKNSGGSPDVKPLPVGRAFAIPPQNRGDHKARQHKKQLSTYPSTTYEQVVMERHSPHRDWPQAIQALNAPDKRVCFGRLVVAKKTQTSRSIRDQRVIVGPSIACQCALIIVPNGGLFGRDTRAFIYRARFAADSRPFISGVLDLSAEGAS